MVTSQSKPTTVGSLCLLNSGKAKYAQCRESPKSLSRTEELARTLLSCWQVSSFVIIQRAKRLHRNHSSTKWKTKDKDNYSLTSSTTTRVFHQEHDEENHFEVLCCLSSMNPHPTPYATFLVTQVSKPLKEKSSVLRENKVVSNTRLPSKSMSRLTKTFVEWNSVEDLISTLWVSQGFFLKHTLV